MNTQPILFFGNRTWQGALDAIPAEQWDTPNVCGWWSVRQIAAHMGSFEALLADVLNMQLKSDIPTPTFNRRAQDGYDFNNEEVALRDTWSVEKIVEEYNQAHAQVMTLVEKIPAELWPQNGTIPWYGEKYSLNDFVVYAYYGHKREHAAQIHVFKDTLKGDG